MHSHFRYTTRTALTVVSAEQAIYGLTSSLQEWQAFLHYCQALECVTKVSLQLQGAQLHASCT